MSCFHATDILPNSVSVYAILYLFTNLMSRIVDCNKSKIRESVRIYSTVYLMARMAFHCSYI